MKMTIVFLVLASTATGFAKSADSKDLNNNARWPAQVGKSTVRNLIYCAFASNDMGLKSIEIFGALSESRGKVVAADIHSLIEITAHEGHRMIYKGGELTINGAVLSGTVLPFDQTAEFTFDKTGSLKFKDKTFITTTCRSVLR